MPQRLRRSLVWITSRTQWWLALALTVAYDTAFFNGFSSRGRLAIVALPLIGALLLSAIAKRHGSTFLILSAAAIVPPAVWIAALVMAARSPDEHPCNIGPFLAFAWLVIGVVQIAVMGVLALLVRGLALYVLRRRARSQASRSVTGG